MNPIAEIDTLIRARYPILYVVTSEETRVQKMIMEVVRPSEKKVYEWSCSTGLNPAGVSMQSQRVRNSPTREPLAALDYVIDHVEPAVFLFKDFHPYLARSQSAVIRKLKEIGLHLKNSHKTLILISPLVEIPTELEKEVTVISVPLPDKGELGLLLDQIIQEVRKFQEVRIDLDAEGRERLLQAALGLTLNEAENVFAKILVQDQRLSGDDVEQVFSEKQQIVRKSGLLEYYSHRETFGQIGGLEALKEWLQKRRLAFSDQARAFGLPPPKGILLLGVQGCGKSLCAKAVAHLWEVPLLRFDIGRMFGSLMGSSEENMRKAIAVAESIAPAILWVDEIDKAFSGTQGSGMSDGGTTARVFGTFLTWLSEKSAPVFVVATANDISELPPELLRKGRLDEIFFVDLPGEEERREIFSIHLQKRGRPPEGFDLDALARSTAGFSGAEIEEAIISSLYDAFYDGSDLSQDYLARTIPETVPLSRTMEEKIASLRNWADGRARAASLSRPANEVPLRDDSGRQRSNG